MKYETYEELAKAYASGELNKDKDILWMDNDCCGLTVGCDDDSDGEEVFEGDGPFDIIEILKLAGIPAEMV
jgi:hypothetical protein